MKTRFQKRIIIYIYLLVCIFYELLVHDVSIKLGEVSNHFYLFLATEVFESCGFRLLTLNQAMYYTGPHKIDQILKPIFF